MIRVDRALTPSAAWRALATQRTARALQDGPAHVVDDSVYGHHNVRATLEEVFSDKCAYCESYATATGPWDVDHFRPKGRVDGLPTHPGYYWLAYDWSNLYLACPMCNQRLRDRPTLDQPEYGAAKGKKDQFPLADETTRATMPADPIGLEVPMLLDPCAEDPEAHFAVGLTGRLVVLGGSARGRATREICNLQRRRLVRLRAKRVGEVLTAIAIARDAAPTKPLEAILDAVVAGFGRADSPYALVARSIRHQPEAFGLT